MTLPRLSFGLFALLSGLVALVSLRWLVAPLAVVMEHMAHYLPDLPLPLWAHLLGAPAALLLAPFQTWKGLRNRYRRLHRALGYGYAIAVLVAGLGSLALLPEFLGSLWAATGFAALAVLWLTFTAAGIARARAGDTAGHRAMMLRSVALTFAAVTLRLIMAPLMATGWTVVETYQITAWACWLPNLVLIELWLRRQSKRAPV